VNILFYGSCNVCALVESMNSRDSILGKSLESHNITSILCQDTKLTQTEFLKVIQEQDIIITVPISNNYRNSYFLSTEFILKNKNEKTKLIIFVSLHSHYYYFDYGHVFEKEIAINKPHHLHFKTLFEFYKKGKTGKQFIDECVYNPEFKSYEELHSFATQDIEELSRRQDLLVNFKKEYQNVEVIDAVTFIKNNHKKHLMFYSLNHPSNYLLYFIAEEILKLLKISEKLINRNAIAFDDKFLLYSCQQKYFDFDINARTPDFKLISNNNNINSLQEAVSYYYDSYKEQNIEKY